MEREAFVRAVRNHLIEVPLEGRRIWSNTDLYIWWLETKACNIHLRWEGLPNDSWLQVPGICRDLIGKSAVW